MTQSKTEEEMNEETSSPLMKLFNKRFAFSSIRDRMLVVSILMVMVPAATITFASAAYGFRNGRQQVIDQLDSVATLKEAEINTWVQDLEEDLGAVLLGQEVHQRASELLLASQEDEDLSTERYSHLLQHFQRAVDHSLDFDELLLIDLGGRVILSTMPAREGQYHLGQTYFQRGLSEPYIRPLSYPILANRGSVIVVQPVFDQFGATQGVLASYANTTTLTEIMQERSGLGETGETYLVGRNHLMLTEPQSHQGRISSSFYAFSEGIKQALEEGINGSGTYANYRGQRVIGVYRWLPDLDVVLMAEQSRSEAFEGILSTLRINVGVAATAIILAVVGSLLFTRSIASPLSTLANSAVQVSDGDLDQTVGIERDDEIGALAKAFNSMTFQLRSLVDGLERRVEERTIALHEASEATRRRALQLETGAKVSREITSILQINELLVRVVDLIREAFGYYGVDIYLLEKENRVLTLEAGSWATSMEARKRKRIKIEDRGLNSKAVRVDDVIVSNDVSIDPEFLIDESMLETRSELVIPLRVKGEVIGTLDVQSEDINAFLPEDIVVLQSLSDQVAVAIVNARLYDRSRDIAVTEERVRLARELHDSVTQSLFSLDLHAKALATHLDRDMVRARDQIQQIRRITHDTLSEMRSLIFDLQPSANKRGSLGASLKKLVRGFDRPGGPDFTVRVVGSDRLSPRMEQELFRIAQEAIHNAIRHADSKNVEVRLDVSDGRVRLLVTDDGKGFDPIILESMSRAYGLAGMEERSSQIGGELIIDTGLGRGTKVEAIIPL